jgi:hypothetical protein
MHFKLGHKTQQWHVFSIVLCFIFLRTAKSAGWCEGMDRGESCGKEHARSVEAQRLWLNPGETPRDAVWGAGMIEQTIEVDVLVAGGGSAGTSAAIAAARNGASVVLANGRPVLGGNSGSEVRLTMVGACAPRTGSGETNALKLECREGGIVEEYQLDNTVNNPDHVPELFSLELLTLIKAEPKLTLFQNTWLVGVTRVNGSSAGEPGRITSGILEDQASQRRYIIKAKSYIDATGDGRLGVEAGAEWIQGREGAAKYNESLAKLGFYRDADDGPGASDSLDALLNSLCLHATRKSSLHEEYPVSTMATPKRTHARTCIRILTRTRARAHTTHIHIRTHTHTFTHATMHAHTDHETEGTSVDFMAEAKPDDGTPRVFRAPFWATKYNKSQFQYRSVQGSYRSGCLKCCEPVCTRF